MRRAGWAEDEENRRLDCRNETSGQHSLRESVGAGTTGWSSKARERERERETPCRLCSFSPYNVFFAWPGHTWKRLTGPVMYLTIR